MKNEDIHAEFSSEDIRTYLAKELRIAMEHGGATGKAGIKILEKKLEEIQETIKACRRFVVVSEMIEERGWTDWDVTDNIPYNREKYFPFIGTGKEYNILLEKLSEGEE